MSPGPASETPSPDASGGPGPEFKVELTVDGRRLPLKAFLHDIIGGSVAGMVRGLEGTDALREIDIRIRRRAVDPSDSH